MAFTNAETLLISKRRAPGEVRGADSDSALAVEREAPQAHDTPPFNLPMTVRRARQSGGAGRGAGSCRVLPQLPKSLDFTNADTFPMSARPANLDFKAPMTFPMSAGVLAPVAPSASATAASISVSESAWGM